MGGSVKNGGVLRKKNSFPTALINNRRVWGDLGTGKEGCSTLNPKASEVGQALHKLGVRRDWVRDCI